ncbi:MAG TPA: ribonuclease R [Longimicrobiales bacterium]
MPVSPERIIDFLREEAGRPLKPIELATELEIPEAQIDDFTKLLAELEQQGLLYRNKQQRYAVPTKINLVVGTLQTIRSGAGFVVPEEGDQDLYIAREGLRSAVNGDRVIARVEKRKRGGKMEGRVVRVLERARQTVVGVYHPTKNFGFVVPEDLTLPNDVFVPPGQEGEATEGDVVVVRIEDWGDQHRGPAGQVEKVLGKMGEPGVDVLAVLYGHELPVEFPQEVVDAAEKMRQRGITEADLAGREDLRHELIFTIDPVDAKDHDDALSCKQIDDNLWEVGVHIADVSYYVTEGSIIDAEALRRGTSIYMVDRTIPMLPDPLSSDLCSLKADVDRLAMSVMVRMDGQGNIVAHKLARTVMRSRHKLAYEQAQAVIDGTASIDAETDQAIHQLVKLSRVLREKRAVRGSLDFDLPEARVVLNQEGEPTDIKKVDRLESHRLIEDFMLLANEVIARKGARNKLPFLYRVHEPPDQERLGKLQMFAGTFGYQVTTGGKVTPKDLQRLLERVKGKPEERLLSTVVLRSMRQARYSHENLGHFGLAAKFYTHFTSPIRRYPDLIVHRVCAHAFLNEENVRQAMNATQLPEVARVASTRERVAVDAERDSIEMKKVEFMQRHVGDTFTASVSSVTAFGFFVLLDEYFVEGLVHISSLEDDYYQFVEEQYSLVGERTRRRFRLGDRVKVLVARVDLEERKIDFVLLEEERGKGQKPAKGDREKKGGGRKGGPPQGGRRKARAAR